MWYLREYSKGKNWGWNGINSGEAHILPKLGDMRSDCIFLDSLLLLMRAGIITEITAYIIPEGSTNGEAEKTTIFNADQTELGYIRHALSEGYITRIYYLKIRIDKINKIIDTYLLRWWHNNFSSPREILYPVSVQLKEMINHLSTYKKAFVDQWFSVREAEFWETFDFFPLLLFLERREVIILSWEVEKDQFVEDQAYDDEIRKSFRVKIMGSIDLIKDAKVVKLYYDFANKTLWIDGVEVIFKNQQARIIDFVFDQIDQKNITFQDIIEDPEFSDLEDMESWEYKYLSNTFWNINRKLAEKWYPDLFDIAGWKISFNQKYLVIVEDSPSFNPI